MLTPTVGRAKLELDDILSRCLTPADVVLRHTPTTFVTNPNVPRGVPNVTPMTLLDTPTLPSSSAAERADRLTAAGSAWGERIAADTSAAHLTYTVHGSGQGSVGTALRAGKHEFFIDEPGALAGDDVAASPVEFALGALAACQVVVYRLYAQALGIQVDDVDVKLKAIWMPAASSASTSQCARASVPCD